MQLEFPVYGVEGEQAAFANCMVIRARNSHEDPIRVGHLVVLDPQKNACHSVAAREQIEMCALGIVLSDGQENEFGLGETVRVLRRGRVYVHLDSAVEAAGDSVFVNFQTGGFCGKQTTDTVQLTQAFFLSAGKSSDVILLELDLLPKDYRDEDYCRTRV